MEFSLETKDLIFSAILLLFILSVVGLSIYSITLKSNLEDKKQANQNLQEQVENLEQQKNSLEQTSEDRQSSVQELKELRNLTFEEMKNWRTRYYEQANETLAPRYEVSPLGISDISREEVTIKGEFISQSNSTLRNVEISCEGEFSYGGADRSGGADLTGTIVDIGTVQPFQAESFETRIPHNPATQKTVNRTYSLKNTDCSTSNIQYQYRSIPDFSEDDQLFFQ